MIAFALKSQMSAKFDLTYPDLIDFQNNVLSWVGESFAPLFQLPLGPALGLDDLKKIYAYFNEQLIDQHINELGPLIGGVVA